MGCLNVSTEQLNVPIYIIANGCDNLHVNAFIVTPNITVNSTHVGAELKVCCNIVCGTPNNYYLNVTPNVVWLTPDMIGGEFDIYSNVVWKID